MATKIVLELVDTSDAPIDLGANKMMGVFNIECEGPGKVLVLMFKSALKMHEGFAAVARQAIHEYNMEKNKNQN